MTAKMMAVGYAASLPITDERSLFEFETPVPQPGVRDLLVRVAGGLRQSGGLQGARASRGPRPSRVMLGWDAAGTSRRWARLPRCSSPATTSTTPAHQPARHQRELPLVDERIVGAQAEVADFAQAAALPLTTLTAWELLFDRIGVKRGDGADRRSLLIVGGAGGVGSIAIQLARKLTGLTVIATASRPRRRPGCASSAPTTSIDHSKPFAPQLKAAGSPSVDIVLALTGTARNASADHARSSRLRAASA